MENKSSRKNYLEDLNDDIIKHEKILLEKFDKLHDEDHAYNEVKRKIYEELIAFCQEELDKKFIENFLKTKQIKDNSSLSHQPQDSKNKNADSQQNLPQKKIKHFEFTKVKRKCEVLIEINRPTKKKKN